MSWLVRLFFTDSALVSGIFNWSENSAPGFAASLWSRCHLASLPPLVTCMPVRNFQVGLKGTWGVFYPPSISLLFTYIWLIHNPALHLTTHQCPAIHCFGLFLSGPNIIGFNFPSSIPLLSSGAPMWLGVPCLPWLPDADQWRQSFRHLHAWPDGPCSLAQCWGVASHLLGCDLPARRHMTSDVRRRVRTSYKSAYTALSVQRAVGSCCDGGRLHKIQICGNFLYLSSDTCLLTLFLLPFHSI